MAAFRRAIELGAGYIEADIHLTSDGQFVCIYETSLDRTTSGTGDMNQDMLERLRSPDAGSKFHARFADERIPTLGELFALARGKGIGLYREQKCMLDEAACLNPSDAAVAAGIEGSVVVFAFRPVLLKKPHAAALALTIAMLFEQPIRATSCGLRKGWACASSAPSVLALHRSSPGKPTPMALPSTPGRSTSPKAFARLSKPVWTKSSAIILTAR
jgi:glycerophosphoryl diester phosphodiesterase